MSDRGFGQRFRFKSLTGGSLRYQGVSVPGAKFTEKHEFRNYFLRPSFRPFGPSSCLPLECRRTRQAAGWEEDICGYTPKHVDFAGKDYGLGFFAPRRSF